MTLLDDIFYSYMKVNNRYLVDAAVIGLLALLFDGRELRMGIL